MENYGEKTSQIITLLESLSILKYTLYSNFYLRDNRVIEIRDVKEYYKLMKHLNLKSHKEYVGSPCFIDKLEASYGGWIFKTSVSRDNSKLRAIVDKFKKEKLLA